MRTRFGICQRKRRYAAEAEALQAAAKAAVTLRPYRCALCRQYHLTGRTKGLRVPRFVLERKKDEDGREDFTAS
ncbi:hypothetical protein [Novosphingobium sp. ST904]|uniref:hypothetical protein n=1 Tax=Novosphingobium sp. ST904 TaxID=1684385 RepID=UPI00104E9B94|nr:hypothetical protein [Novosphingobium sp. ST904]TCM40560.1 hypothetical protein EDF59_10432 [Novosphingobium sp. ST904]